MMEQIERSSNAPDGMTLRRTTAHNEVSWGNSGLRQQQQGAV
jgi:hypothetical protein